jgi:hypothetical protein
MSRNSALNIKFTGSNPNGRGNKAATQRITLELQLETTMGLDDLKEILLNGFKVHRNDQSNYRHEFMIGFPPKPLDTLGMNVVGDLPFRNNENVIVRIFRIETPSRPKRKAAEVAKSSFKDSLKAQDAMMRHNSTKPKNLSSPKIRMQGPGYRLSDGVSNAITSNKMNGRDKQLCGPKTFDAAQKGKKIHPSKFTIVLKNEDDISSFLIQTFNKGGGGKPFTQIREVFKKALTHMQENSLAQARVYAATLGQFLMAPVKSVDVVDGRALGSTFHETEKDHCILYQISFGKDMSKNTGHYTDRIKVLPLDILKRVIENAYTSEKDDEGDDDDENQNVLDTGKELLRPIAIAQMMPQIFWSLIYHCRPCSDSNIQEYYLSVEDMLRQLLPNLDWSYLNRDGRQRLLSEQAKENLRQAKKNCDEWVLITPTEYDEDELMACISSEGTSTEYNIAKTYTSLMIRSKSKPRCFNQRQLANTETEYLHNKLIRECKKSAIEPPSLSSVQTWIDNARDCSLYEIMNEIIGMDDNIYQLLEAMYSNTPRDLITFWGRHPKLLLETMEKHPKNEDNLFHVHYQEKDARRWISRAKVAISMCPWLDEYLCPFDE